MRYFLNVYETLLMFPFAFIAFITYLLLLGLLFSGLEKLFQLIKKYRWISLTGTIFGAGILLWLTLLYLPFFMNDGKITWSYLFRQDQQIRLVLWFTHTQPANMIDVYSNRLKSFDLKSGKKLKKLNLNHRSYWDDYEIYGPSGNLAWGYSEQTGPALIDLYDLKILQDQDRIRQLNPELGEIFKPAHRNFYHRQDHCLLFSNAQGKFVHVMTKLKRKKVETLTFEKSDNLDYPIPLDKESVYAAAKVDGELFVFITRKGYTLSALKINPVTGKILERIKYL